MLFTIIVRLVLLPLSLPALKNARRQQALAPQVRAIQKKHAKDRSAASQATMELYRSYGFNPFSGCLPILAQAPIFFALWQAIQRVGAQAAHGGFLWITQIGRPDPLYLLPVLAAVAQFLQTRMAMQPKAMVTDPQQRMTNTMMQFTPVLAIVFGSQIPAGAVLYWFVSSLFSAVLQYLITGWGSLQDLLPFLPHKERRAFLPSAPLQPHEIKQTRMQKLQDRMIQLQQEQQAQQAPKQGGTTSQQLQREKRPKASPADTAEARQVEDLSGSQLTDDAWRLPGAPGSGGSASTTTTVTPPDTALGNGADSNGDGDGAGGVTERVYTPSKNGTRQRGSNRRRKRR
jgi:YidC/Oxa1 family membrane protein insertase